MPPLADRPASGLRGARPESRPLAHPLAQGILPRGPPLPPASTRRLRCRKFADTDGRTPLTDFLRGSRRRQFDPSGSISNAQEISIDEGNPPSRPSTWPLCPRRRSPSSGARGLPDSRAGAARQVGGGSITPPASTTTSSSLSASPAERRAPGPGGEERQLQDRGGAVQARRPKRGVSVDRESRVLSSVFSRVFTGAAELGTSPRCGPDEQIANSRRSPGLLLMRRFSTSSAPGRRRRRGRGPGPHHSPSALRDFDHIRAARPRTGAARAVLQGRGVDAPAPGALLALEEMAAVAASAHSTLPASSRQATGHPPHDYLIRLRVDRAQGGELIRPASPEWTRGHRQRMPASPTRATWPAIQAGARAAGVNLPMPRFHPLISIAQDRFHVRAQTVQAPIPRQRESLPYDRPVMWIVRLALRRPLTFIRRRRSCCFCSRRMCFLRTADRHFSGDHIRSFRSSGNTRAASTGNRTAHPLQSRTLHVRHGHDIEHTESTSYNGVGIIKVFLHPARGRRSRGPKLTAVGTILRQMPAARLRR